MIPCQARTPLLYNQPLGDFKQSSSTDCSPCIDDLVDFTERFDGFPVVVLPKVTIKLPEEKGKLQNCCFQVV